MGGESSSITQEPRPDEGKVPGCLEAENIEPPGHDKEVILGRGALDEDENSEQKPAAGWMREEQEAGEDRHSDALDLSSALANRARCRGQLDDGSLCIRRPSPGLPYCAIHAADWSSAAPPSGDPV